ncbi:ABC transporter permease subunit [Prosthecomicrobium sp. N25]|uniref:ABC transporter permease subunit n=1 Tax=Prosthecomicrobium sp. N25 TaxID=3129254 RepID=UPI0030784FF9
MADLSAALGLAAAWMPRLLTATALTLAIAAAVFTISAVFGLLLALVNRDAPRPLRWAIEAFSGVLRAIPELVVLFAVFFGGRQIGAAIDPVASTILAFGLVGIAYDFQVFKGALGVIPEGQFEAGRALGMRPWQVYGAVVLPQLLPIARKGWITYAIGTIKRISIASAISVSELMYVTKQAIAASNAPFLFLSLATGLYVLIVMPLLAFNERQPAHR